MNDLIRIFIGHDRPNPVLLQTLIHSLVLRSSRPLAITPISLDHLKGTLTRPRDPNQSTEFSFSRFLVPYLAGYEGWAIYMDNDFLARADVAELWELRDDRYAVMCVQHDYTPTAKTKFSGAVQTRYAKKNWSSLMLMNCNGCRALTVPFVNSASGLQLHQFSWLPDERLVGALPPSWNHLAGHYPYDREAKLVHFTEGGPYFESVPHGDYADEWLNTFRKCCQSADMTIDDLARRARGV